MCNSLHDGKHMQGEGTLKGRKGVTSVCKLSARSFYSHLFHALSFLVSHGPCLSNTKDSLHHSPHWGFIRGKPARTFFNEHLIQLFNTIPETKLALKMNELVNRNVSLHPCLSNGNHDFCFSQGELLASTQKLVSTVICTPPLSKTSRAAEGGRKRSGV